jgi:hypothetical protein
MPRAYPEPQEFHVSNGLEQSSSRRVAEGLGCSVHGVRSGFIPIRFPR